MGSQHQKVDNCIVCVSISAYNRRFFIQVYFTGSRNFQESGMSMNQIRGALMSRRTLVILSLHAVCIPSTSAEAARVMAMKPVLFPTPPSILAEMPEMPKMPKMFLPEPLSFPEFPAIPAIPHIPPTPAIPPIPKLDNLRKVAVLKMSVRRNGGHISIICGGGKAGKKIKWSLDRNDVEGLSGVSVGEAENGSGVMRISKDEFNYDNKNPSICCGERGKKVDDKKNSCSYASHSNQVCETVQLEPSDVKNESMQASSYASSAIVNGEV